MLPVMYFSKIDVEKYLTKISNEIIRVNCKKEDFLLKKFYSDNKPEVDTISIDNKDIENMFAQNTNNNTIIIAKTISVLTTDKEVIDIYPLFDFQDKNIKVKYLDNKNDSANIKLCMNVAEIADLIMTNLPIIITGFIGTWASIINIYEFYTKNKINSNIKIYIGNGNLIEIPTECLTLDELKEIIEYLKKLK